jgi:hypothetical protein
MRRLNAFIAGTIVAASVALATTVAYGVDFASEKELCASQWKHFQVIRSQAGLIELSDEQFTDYHTAAQGIVDAEDVRRNKFNVDKNYSNVSAEVTFHANEILKASSSVHDQEEVQVQYRWVTISCKNCHRMYRTDERISP